MSQADEIREEIDKVNAHLREVAAGLSKLAQDALEADIHGWWPTRQASKIIRIASVYLDEASLAMRQLELFK